MPDSVGAGEFHQRVAGTNLRKKAGPFDGVDVYPVTNDDSRAFLSAVLKCKKAVKEYPS